MPRHRKECGPKHGALRRERSSRRSVVPRAPAFGPGFGRDAGRALAPTARRPRRRLARSLLATPWFAAGAGIVIAAVLAVDSPAALTYGPTFPSSRCPARGCASAPGYLPAAPATATPGVELKVPGLETKGGTARAGRPGQAHRGDLVGYQVVRRWLSGFMAVITIPAAARARAWSLGFAFPAAHVDRVWGARWQPFGDGDGGTANGPLQWPGHSREPRGMGADQMMVSATGTPGTPSGCTLDGISCRFGSGPVASGPRGLRSAG